MKHILWPMILAALIAPAADLKQLPGQAGNDDIDLSASVILTPEEVQQALGADLGMGYLAVRMKATPKTEKPLRIGPDDFTIISRKDGQRSEALLPEEIAGSGGALVVKSAQGDQNQSKRSVIIGGFGGSGGTGNSNAAANAGVEVKAADPKAADSPLLAALKAKGFPDKETKEPLEGLLYFRLDGKLKLKPKDVSLLYKGPAGRMIIEFEALKGR